jgi:hypothetical protein
MVMRARAATRGRRQAPPRYVPFQYEDTRYTVSPERSKVYSEWVEVETSRAVEILTAYRNSQGR